MVVFPHEFQRSFPATAAVLQRPGRLLFLAIGLSLLLAPFSRIFALAPLCLWTLPASLCLERRWLGCLLIPPFTGTVLFWGLGTSLSLPLLSVLGSDEFLSGYVGVQTGYLLGWPFAAAGYWSGALYRAADPPFRPIRLAAACPPLTSFVWLWLFLSLGLSPAHHLIPWESIPSGFFPFHSGPTGTFAANFLRAFPWLYTPVFFLLPLLWFRSGNILKTVLISALAGYFFLVCTDGVRGNLLHPILFLVSGFYFFRQADTPRMEKTFLGLLALFLLVMFFGLVGRGNLRALASEDSGILKKAKVLIWSPLRPSQPYRELIPPFLQSFHGNFDERIHARTPMAIPFAGWQDLGAVRQVWLPQSLFPDKPSLLRNETVYEQYCSPHQIQWHRERNEKIGTGAGLSLAGDAFRRFGLAGVPPVCFVVFLGFGLLCRWLLNLGQGTSLFHWALMAVAVALFQARPIGSLGNTLWQLLYNFPKQMIVLFLMTAAFGIFFRIAHSRKSLTQGEWQGEDPSREGREN